jgi:hypothetical protein
MSDRLEAAASGRARCRACGGKIDKGALRFGEELPNAYGEGDATSVYWFHPRCAAHRRPERIAPVLRSAEEAAALPDRESLVHEADLGIAHPRLPRVAGAERSASARARCRHCRELIPGGVWRVKLSAFEESGFFEPLGFLHTGCAFAYFEISGEPGVAALAARLRQASSDLDDAAIAEILTVAEPPPG